VLVSAHVPQHDFRQYIGRSQFLKFVHNLSANRSIPEWVSREDVLCQVQTIKNLIRLVSIDKRSNTHLRKIYKFGKWINAYVIEQEAENTIIFADVKVLDMLEIGDWSVLVGACANTSQRIKLLASELVNIIDKLSIKLASAVAFMSRQQWNEYVNKCFSQGGGKCLLI